MFFLEALEVDLFAVLDPLRGPFIRPTSAPSPAIARLSPLGLRVLSALLLALREPTMPSKAWVARP